MTRHVVSPYKRHFVQLGDGGQEVFLRAVEMTKSSFYGDGHLMLTVESDAEVYDILAVMDLVDLVSLCKTFLKEVGEL